MFNKGDISKAIQFITTDIWRIRSGDLSRNRSFLIRLLRILILTIRGLGEDRWHLWASALTYYSLLSIVPVAAMIFGIAKGFGFEKALEKLLYKNLEGQEQVVARVVDFAQSLLQNVKGGIVAEGRSDAPIYFTSDAAQPQNGDWSMLRVLSPTGPVKFS